MRRDASSPAAYRRAVSGDQRKLLEAIRTVVCEVAPDVREGIAYGMLDYPGLANLGAQKHYVALYVAPEVLKKHLEDFAGVELSAAHTEEPPQTFEGRSGGGGGSINRAPATRASQQSFSHAEPARRRNRRRGGVFWPASRTALRVRTLRCGMRVECTGVADTYVHRSDRAGALATHATYDGCYINAHQSGPGAAAHSAPRSHHR